MYYTYIHTDEEWKEMQDWMVKSLKSLKLPQQPDPKILMQYEVNLDKVRTFTAIKFADISAAFETYNTLLKHEKEKAFVRVKQGLMANNKKPTEKEISSWVSIEVEKIMIEEYNRSLVDIVFLLQFRYSFVQKIAEMLKAKQDATYIHNNVMKADLEMSKILN